MTFEDLIFSKGGYIYYPLIKDEDGGEDVLAPMTAGEIADLLFDQKKMLFYNVNGEYLIELNMSYEYEA